MQPGMEARACGSGGLRQHHWKARQHYFCKRVCQAIDDILDGLLDEEGLLAARTDGITESVKRLEKQTDAFNIKLELIEKRYRDQYTRLDTLLSSLQNTSSYLAQQIQSISNTMAKGMHDVWI